MLLKIGRVMACQSEGKIKTAIQSQTPKLPFSEVTLQHTKMAIQQTKR